MLYNKIIDAYDKSATFHKILELVVQEIHNKSITNRTGGVRPFPRYVVIMSFSSIHNAMLSVYLRESVVVACLTAMREDQSREWVTQSDP